jgi:hypothetical protein
VARRGGAELAQAAEVSMRFETTCPSCGGQNSQDTIYGGTRRPCSACGAAVPVVVPPAVREAMRTSVKQKTPGGASVVPKTLMAMTCERCLATASQQVAEGATRVRCTLCGATFEPAAAAALAAGFQQIEDTFFAALLQGADDARVEEALRPLGASPRLVRGLYAHRAHLLPAVRRAVQEQLAAGQLRGMALGLPPVCDLCRARPLQPVLAQTDWRLLLSEETRLSGVTAVTLFAGVAVSKTTSQYAFISGLYATCAPCFAHFDRLFGHTWKGYPADQGYELVGFRKLR